MTRVLGWLLVLVVFVSAVPWEVVVEPSDSAQQELAEVAGQQCPSSSTGEPCDDGCLCPFCPAWALITLSSEVGFDSAPDTQAARPSYARDPHASEFVDRVFHPPRVG